MEGNIASGKSTLLSKLDLINSVEVSLVMCTFIKYDVSSNGKVKRGNSGQRVIPITQSYA